MEMMDRSHSAQFMTENDYLLVRCSANATLDQKEKTLDTVVDYINGKSVKKVLFDVRESLVSMTEDDHLSCGQLILDRVDHLSKSKVAFLINKKDPVLFLSAAYADGYTNFLEVDCEKDASMWFSGVIK